MLDLVDSDEPPLRLLLGSNGLPVVEAVSGSVLPCGRRGKGSLTQPTGSRLSEHLLM